MDKFEIDRTHAESKWDKAMLQLMGWLLALSIAGVIVTALLAVLKTVAYGVIVAGAVCLGVALLAMWGYHATKWRIQKAVYDHDVRQMQQQIETQQKELSKR